MSFEIIAPTISAALRQRFKRENRLLNEGTEDGLRVLAFTTKVDEERDQVEKEAPCLLCIPDHLIPDTCTIYFYSGEIEPANLISNMAMNVKFVEESLIDTLYEFLANRKLPEGLLTPILH